MTAVLTVASLLGALFGCESLPPPRDIHRDAETAVQLRPVRGSGADFNHPASVTPEQMAQVLSGVRVQKRRDPVLGLVTGEAVAVPAFSPGEVQALASQLSEALQQASSNEMVTFYRRSSGPSGLAVTSGGMYVRGRALSLILANVRNRPADVLGHRQAMMYEIDPVDDPLLSLSPRSVNLTFQPATALRPDAPEKRRHVDPSKILVVDLDRIPTKP